MSGKKCSLIRGKCPGQFVGGDNYGCPHWREMTIQTEASTPEHWKGCGVLMDPELIVGITKGVNRAAATVQGVRNVMARGFFGMCLSAGLDPSPVVAEIAQGDTDTLNGMNSLALEPANGHKEEY
jgi:hypothetical protein